MDIEKSLMGSPLWERQPSETVKAFEAFKTYRDLPLYGEPEERRSIANTARILNIAMSGCEKWSAANDWVERAAAYDQYKSTRVMDVKLVALEEFQRATIQSLSKQLVALNTLIEQDLDVLLQKSDRKESIADDLKKLAGVIKTKDDLARRMSGLPTTYTSEIVQESNNDEEETYIIGG